MTTCRKFTFVFKLLILVKSSKDLLWKNLKIINSAFKSEKEILKINKRFYMKYKGNILVHKDIWSINIYTSKRCTTVLQQLSKYIQLYVHWISRGLLDNKSKFIWHLSVHDYHFYNQYISIVKSGVFARTRCSSTTFYGNSDTCNQ